MHGGTLLAVLDFTRSRLLGSLDAIEKSAADADAVLRWRPGPGRAHISWQAMHCAVTHDKYLHLRLLGQPIADPVLVDAFGGGSVPSDENVPGLGLIRERLAVNLERFKAFVAGCTGEQLAGKPPAGGDRSIAEHAMLMAWHEAHHQGQIHLTWNLYKAAHGL